MDNFKAVSNHLIGFKLPQVHVHTVGGGDNHITCTIQFKTEAAVFCTQYTCTCII